MIFTDERRRRGAVLVTPAIQMTAAASGSNGITVADDNDIDAGTASFGAHWEGSRDSWRPASAEEIYTKYQDASNYVSLICNTDGTVRLLAVVAGVTILDETSSAAVATTYNGKNLKLTFSCSRETASAAGSFQPYIDAAVLGAAQSITAASPTSISNSGALYIAGTDSKRFASNTISFVMLNFAPTASEVLDLCTNGIPASWKWGSQASAVSGSVLNGTSNRAFSTFSSGADNFTGTTLAGDATLNYAGYSIGVSPGQKIRVKGSFSITGTLGSAAFRINIATSLSNSAALSDTITVSGTSGDFDVVLTATVSATGIVNFSLGTSPVTGATITVTNIAINRQGATLALLPDTIPTSSATTWSDTSGNTGGGTLPAAGATKVTIRR